MWPTKTAGENARLYAAVEAVSDFACKLGINIPTGKDSLSMTQKYPNGETVNSPGTVIISAVAESGDIRKTVSPDLEPIAGSSLLYIDFSRDTYKLGGSSFAQVVNQLGKEAPTITDEKYFIKAFGTIQELIKSELILAGHDISSGGLITTLLEMCFPVPGVGMNVSIKQLGDDIIKVLFNENPAIVIQIKNESAKTILQKNGIDFIELGKITSERQLSIDNLQLTIDNLRDTWFHTSYLFDKIQRPKGHAETRKENIFKQALEYKFQPKFDGKLSTYNLDPKRRTATGIKAAIIREKGVNSDREMAYALYVAGFDVKDVHMTDLMTGREDLSEVNLIVFVGGFSNSDVLGSAKGWAGAFLYNPKAKAALDNFYKRTDTLSLGVCNGCQLMMEMGLLYPDWKEKMHHNGSGKFECSFVNLTIPKNNSVMLKTYEGAQIGVWMAHGEGQFVLPADMSKYEVAANYTQTQYPGNPNDSNFAVAALSSRDGRHLAIMPHIERSLFPWNWPHYPTDRKTDEVGPWFEAFANAREWIKANK
jgi:phosphoribosylformylglycinamidine synthase